MSREKDIKKKTKRDKRVAKGKSLYYNTVTSIKGDDMKKYGKIAANGVNETEKLKWKKNLNNSGETITSFLKKAVPYFARYKTGQELLDVIKAGVEKE